MGGDRGIKKFGFMHDFGVPLILWLPHLSSMATSPSLAPSHKPWDASL